MFGPRRPRNRAQGQKSSQDQDIELTNTASNGNDFERHPKYPHLPRVNHNGHRVHRLIHPDGESGRRFFHPWHFLRVAFRSSSTASMSVNALWPFVPAAIAIHFAGQGREDLEVWIFALNYIAMVPTANLIGFGGQELARKLPKVFGIILETFLGGFVEMILFIVLLSESRNVENGNPEIHGTSLVPVIRAAILGSILANLLLCLGFCFFVGGLTRHEQEFDEAVSEVGSGLLLVAGFGLLIPSAFYNSLSGSHDPFAIEMGTLTISRATAVILLFAFLIYVWFQMRSHHGIYDAVLEKDELRDHDRDKDLAKAKFTFTECIIAIIIALTCVSMHAVFLVQEIEPLVRRRHVSDAFMGLILVPLVEKFAEHLTAVDEAHDNQMNFALAHVLGATIQTALFNAPLITIIGWGIDKGMDLDFEVFNIVVLILAIIVVGNFLRDKKSNYLEGSLCILVYLIIAVAAWYYPNPEEGADSTSETTEGGGDAAATTEAAVAAATEAAARYLFKG